MTDGTALQTAVWPITISHIDCHGNESTLTDCSINMSTIPQCEGFQAALVCQGSIGKQLK